MPLEHFNHLKYLLKFLIIWQFAFRISNAAITALLHLFKQFFLYFGRVFHCKQLQEMSDAVPLTLSTIHRLLSIKEDDFDLYVVCLALSCVTCDIPATRKVCGFLSHNAALGCNKCLKKFNVKFGERTDYSGFNREDWLPRTLEQHVTCIEKINKEVTKTGRQAAESQYGVRYSALLDLPYFDPLDCTAIDSMHNLFLGTGKHVFGVWVDLDILTKQNLKELEGKIKLFHVPHDVGRLPSHLSYYNSFTANQWKNWITLYSCVVLRDILPAEHF